MELVNIKRCEACGAENVRGAVASSIFGAYSGAWCEDCLKIGRDSYSQMVSYIFCAGQWPNDINEDFQAEVRRQLRLHNKTEEDFVRDLDQMLEDFRNEPMPTYIILDSLGEEF